MPNAACGLGTRKESTKCVLYSDLGSWPARSLRVLYTLFYVISRVFSLPFVRVFYSDPPPRFCFTVFYAFFKRVFFVPSFWGRFAAKRDSQPRVQFGASAGVLDAPDCH